LEKKIRDLPREQMMKGQGEIENGDGFGDKVEKKTKGSA